MAAYVIEGLSILLSPVRAGMAPYHVQGWPLITCRGCAHLYAVVPALTGSWFGCWLILSASIAALSCSVCVSCERVVLHCAGLHHLVPVCELQSDAVLTHSLFATGWLCWVHSTVQCSTALVVACSGCNGRTWLHACAGDICIGPGCCLLWCCITCAGLASVGGMPCYTSAITPCTHKNLS